MTDRAKKITEFTAATGVANTDVFVLVQNTTGTAVTKKIVANTLFNAIPTNIVPSSNAAQSVGSATKYWNYLYSNNIVFSSGVTQTIPYTPNVLRVSNTANVTVNSSVTFIFANPGAAGGNVTLIIPNGAYDGKEYIVKNVNTDIYNINIYLANSSALIEDDSGNFGNTFIMSATHGFARWVWDATASTYRILGHS